MVAVIFISPDGAETRIAAAEGASLMQAAVNAGLTGIVGECGGNAICCTCHVYVNDAWLARLPPMDENEDELLEGTASDRTPASRLSCQIKLTADLDGLTVTLPPRQY